MMRFMVVGHWVVWEVQVGGRRVWVGHRLPRRRQYPGSYILG